MDRGEIHYEGPLGVWHTFDRIYWARGGGYWIYWTLCFSGGCIRALVHWVTPCPGLGVGFWKWEIPDPDKVKEGMSYLATAGMKGVEKGVDLTKAGAKKTVEKVGKGVEKTKQASKRATRKVGRGVEKGVAIGKRLKKTLSSVGSEDDDKSEDFSRISFGCESQLESMNEEDEEEGSDDDGFFNAASNSNNV